MLTENRSFPNPRSQKGAALITALFIITVLTILGTLALNTSIVEIKMAANQKVASQVFYTAEAGLDRGLKVLVADMEGDVTSGGPWGNLNFPASAGSVTATYVNGSTAFDVNVRSMDMYLDGDSASQMRKLTFTNGGTSLGNSTYELYIYSPSNDEVYLMSYANGPNGTAALEYHLATEDNSPYNNAIFSGTGLRGRTIHFPWFGLVTGRINVSGSIYSQGFMELGGSSAIANNYTDAGINPVLEAMIPSVTDLNAKVRVKGADLKLRGNAHIGTSNTNGAVSDIQVDGNFSSNKPYFADNVGAEVPNVAMPGILDGLESEYPGVSADPAYSGIGDKTERAMAIYKDLIRGVNGFAAGATYASTVPSGTITSKGVVLDSNWLAGCEPAKLDCGFHGGDLGQLEIKLCTPSVQCVDSLGNGVTYESATHVVTVSGTVYADDRFKIGIGRNVTYVSKGAFVDDGFGNPVAPPNQDEQAALVVAHKKVEIMANFIPDNGGYLKGGSNTNSIGFISGQEIQIRGIPWNMALVSGMFYTPGEIKIGHHAQIAGTLIGGKFRFDWLPFVFPWFQAPAVFQAPALKSYLPQYMPGNQSILSFKNREWRRVY